MRLEKEETSSTSPPNATRVRPTEDTPLLGNPIDSLSSQPKTFANVFIAIVGAGVLGLPYTVMQTGWLTGAVMILSVAALTYHCMMLLVYTRRKVEPALSFSKISSFGDLGFAVCGPLGRCAVDSMIVLTQAGFCVGYTIFIGTTLANLYNSPPSLNLNLRNLNLNLTSSNISAKSLYILGCFPFQLGLNAIPTLTLLAPLSIFADIVQIAAMFVVLVKDVLKFMKHMANVKAFGNASMFFYGLGVAIYSFEGVGMALPLESETKDKAKFGRVLGLTMLFIALMYASFGLFGYFAFGADTMDIITNNFGNGLVSTSVQLGLCVNLFFTLPLMMNPVYEVFERRYWDGCFCLWMRWVLVFVVILVALLVPNFTDFLALVGSSTCCVLGFVLPALFHFITFKNEMGRRGAYSDIGIIVLGIFLGVTGTWSSLVQIFSVKV